MVFESPKCKDPQGYPTFCAELARALVNFEIESDPVSASGLHVWSRKMLCAIKRNAPRQQHENDSNTNSWTFLWLLKPIKVKRWEKTYYRFVDVILQAMSNKIVSRSLCSQIRPLRTISLDSLRLGLQCTWAIPYDTTHRRLSDDTHKWNTRGLVRSAGNPGFTFTQSQKILAVSSVPYTILWRRWTQETPKNPP